MADESDGDDDNVTDRIDNNYDVDDNDDDADDSDDNDDDHLVVSFILSLSLLYVLHNKKEVMYCHQTYCNQLSLIS